MVKQLFFIALLFLASICWAGETTDKPVHSTNTSKADAKKGLVLVAGATGMTGRLVVRTLLENGFHVRAFDVLVLWTDLSVASPAQQILVRKSNAIKNNCFTIVLYLLFSLSTSYTGYLL